MLTPEATRRFSVIVILLALAFVVFAVWMNAQRTRFRRSQYPLYFFGLLMTRFLWRARVFGKMELPTNGGAVIVANHRSPMDPAFVGLGSLSRVRWMVAREYFNVPVFGSMLRLLESIPTRRGGIDTEAVKQTIRSARDGELVGIFPEGRLNDTERLLLPLRNGAAMIALQARVPIIPCYIEGSPYDKDNFYSFFTRPARTTITIGKRLDASEFYDRADDREAQTEVTRRIGRAIADLAGRPDFMPEVMAGRRGAESVTEEIEDADSSRREHEVS